MPTTRQIGRHNQRSPWPLRSRDTQITPPSSSPRKRGHTTQPSLCYADVLGTAPGRGEKKRQEIKMAEVHGNRTNTEFIAKNLFPNQGGAESGALDTGNDSIDTGLQAIIQRWPDLPEAIKTGILAMVQAASGAD